MKNLKILLFTLTLLLHAFAGQTTAQNKSLNWKFPAENAAGAADKATGLTFYELPQGVRAAFKEHEGAAGAVVILPGERLSDDERMQSLIRGADPNRMLTALAVALTLPMPTDTDNFFISKEKLNNRFVYRWKTDGGTVVCAQPLALKPFSDEHDVVFVGACSEKDKGFVALMSENAGGTLQGYERYRPRTLAEIIKAHANPEILKKNDGSMILTGETFPSKVRVVYTGKTRSVSPAKKQHLDMLVASFNVDPKVIERFQTEMLFTEGADEFWLPVVKELIPFFEKEVKAGEDVIIYAEWVGAKKIDGKLEWVFMVNEFQK